MSFLLFTLALILADLLLVKPLLALLVGRLRRISGLGARRALAVSLAMAACLTGAFILVLVARWLGLTSAVLQVVLLVIMTGVAGIWLRVLLRTTPGRGWLLFWVLLGTTLVQAYFWTTQIGIVGRVAGSEMSTALMTGDMVLFNRLAPERGWLETGDLVLVRAPEKDSRSGQGVFLRRIAEISGNGTVVLGCDGPDQGPGCDDGGPVALKDILARAEVVYWSYDDKAQKMRWNRVGLTLR